MHAAGSAPLFCRDCRRGAQEAACEKEESLTSGWLPAWAQPWGQTVNVTAYQIRTQGMVVQDVIRATTTALKQL